MILPALSPQRLFTETKFPQRTGQGQCKLPLPQLSCAAHGTAEAALAMCSPQSDLHSDTETFRPLSAAGILFARQIVRLAMPLLSQTTQSKQSKYEV